MRKIELNELKQIQIEILDVVANFCERNSINYWLDCGTLLGAVRHKGYIPWDDDIDIGMLREDYNKFMSLFNKSNTRYKFYCIENNNQFYYPYGKVLDTNTTLYEPDEKYGNKINVNIDIFVYDNAPNDKKLLEKMYKKRDLYNILNAIQLYPVSYDKNKKLKSFFRKIIYFILNILPKGYFVKKIINNSKKYSRIDTQFVGNFTSLSKIKANKNIFRELIYLEFEGKEYCVPIGYDEWLRLFYGNYMELPPKEKQISHHSFVAYLNDERK